MVNFEKGVGTKNLFRDFKKDVSFKSVTNGLVATIFMMTFLVFFWAVLPKYGLDSSLMDGWITGCMMIMGIGTIFLSAYYRKPIGLAGSFAGWLCALNASTIYTQPEVFAGCLMSGVILTILAFSGLMKKVLKFLPTPVVMGMIAGCFLNYGLYIVNPLSEEPFVVILMILAYLVTSKFSRRIPGVLSALIIAIVYYAASGLDFPPVEITARLPNFVMPAFTANFPKIFISLTIPLTALVLGAENSQAYGVLETEEYNPPVNSMTLVSGIGGILSALLGSINTNIAGPLTAICASPDSGKKEGRWTAVIVLGICQLILAPFYASLVGLIVSFPNTFVYLVTGLSVLGVLVSALMGAFKTNSHRISGVFAFLIAASGIKMMGLSAAFWALLIGDLIYIFYENGLKKKEKEAALTV